jgi:hypothetical protein
MTRKRNSSAFCAAALGALAIWSFSVVHAEVPAYRQTAQVHANQVQANQVQANQVQANQVQAKPSAKPPAAKSAAPGTTAQPDKPSPPASLLEQPAQPAKIQLSAGKLTVQANNSNLSDILHEIAKESGMKIEGLAGGAGANQRVFGSYGPGTPQGVLSDLLSDSGYNVLMLGVTSSGAPRELALTARAGGGAAAPTSAANTPQPQSNGDDTEPAQDQGVEQSNPDQPPVPPEIRNGVRTPQQLLQELQRMRQQQQQEQDQDQQNDQPQD